MIVIRSKLLLFSAFLAGVLSCLSFQWLGVSLASISPPLPGYAKAIINDCDKFTTVEAGFRRVETVTAIGQSRDSGGGQTWVEFKWKWVSKGDLQDSILHDATSVFSYSNEAKEWRVQEITTPPPAPNTHESDLERIYCRK